MSGLIGGARITMVDGPEGRLVPKAVWPSERDEDGEWIARHEVPSGLVGEYEE